MSLREILQKIANSPDAIILNDDTGEWDAGSLLTNLSEPKLRVSAYFQSGLYIAEVDPRGYLGRVLYRVKTRT